MSQDDWLEPMPFHTTGRFAKGTTSSESAIRYTFQVVSRDWPLYEVLQGPLVPTRVAAGSADTAVWTVADEVRR